MSTENKLQKSTFVTALAWIFIVLTGFSTFMTAAQNIMVRLMFTDSQMHKMQSQSQASEQIPAVAQFMLNHFDLFFLAAFLISLTMLVAAIGLLKRKNWARLTFIIILTLGIIWNLAGIFIQQIFMSDIPLDANTPEEFRKHWETMHTFMTIFTIVFALLITSLFGWIIRKLMSPPIVNEFKS